MLVREVVKLGAVDLRVVELPLVVVEVAPTAQGRMIRDRLPTFVPDPPRAEHRVELRLAFRRGLGVVEAGAHADAVEVGLGVALDRLRRLDSEHVEDRRDDVDRVVILLADLTLGLDARRPRDDARVARAAVELVALPHLERRVEGHRPAVRVMVVRLGATELVEQRHIRLDRVRDSVGELHLVHRTIWPTFARSAVVRNQDDESVFEPAELLEEAEQPSDLIIGVSEESCVHLGHAREQLLLVVRE